MASACSSGDRAIPSRLKPAPCPAAAAPRTPPCKFAFGENGKNTGLTSGEYKVTFSQTLVNGKPTLAGSGGKKWEKVPSEKESVADEYRDPEKTPITVSIGSGTNDFTFEIKAKK